MTERAFRADAREATGLHDGSISLLMRVVDPQPTMPGEIDTVAHDNRTPPEWWAWQGRGDDAEAMERLPACPFGVVGDRLWVQEEWYYDLLGLDLASRFPGDYDPKSMYYRADGECCEQIPECCCHEVGPTPWRTAEQLPRWASRTLLDVTGVRVVRAQEITEEDALAIGGWKYLTCPYHKDPVKSVRMKILTCDTWTANAWLWLATVAKVEEK